MLQCKICYAANQWYKIALQLDWTNKVVHYYANDILVMNNILFCNSTLTNLAVVNLYNFDNTQAWWDQFSTVKAVGSAFPLGVTNTGSFTNGVWHGLLSLSQTGTNVTLIAKDSTNHQGSSSAFAAIAPAMVSVAVAASPVLAGTVGGAGSFTPGSQQTLTATTNSGWKFIHWQDGNLQNPRLITVPASNVTYTAVFAQPPQITSQPASQIVNPGAAATFSVTATGTSPLTFAWQRNGTLIANATNTSYTLSAAQMSDSGSLFGCSVSNAAGGLTSQGAKLTVRTLLQTSNTGKTASGFTLAFSGTAGSNYVVLVSTNLQSWTPLDTLQLTNSTEIFRDTNAKSVSQFYRVSGAQ